MTIPTTYAWMARTSFRVGLASLCLSAAMLLLSGCKSSGSAITVQILPTTTVSLDEGESINFTATVANDTLNKGVSWSLVQSSSTACSGSGCGVLKNVTNSSATYTAPTGLAATESVTLTVASVSQPSATTTATISVVLPPQFTTTTLPNGANGVAYNQTITVTGGVTPLTFSLQAGSSLPAGLSLTTGGTIVGKPSTPSLGGQTTQFSFTVAVTDNSSKNGTLPTTLVSVTQAYTISISPPAPLSVTTTSLPLAISNTKYAPPPIAAQGGVLPLTWSLVSSSGPASFNTLGLALSPSSGQITGVIPPGVTTGTYTVTVQALDSSLPASQTAQKTLTIAVQAPQPLAITTTVLPSGTTATAYSVPLQASGGIPPYTWTLSSGLLPSGLVLGPNGIVSGVPVRTTINPDTFTVEVQDSEAQPGPPVSQALSLSIVAGSTNANSLVTGPYSFLFNGFDTNGSVMIAGTITTDGNGNITSGLEDSNRVSGVISGIPLTGTYSLGSDGRGTMQLMATNPSTKVSLTTDYRIVLDSSGNIHFIQNNDITTPGVGTDTLGTHGEGILKPVIGTSAAGAFVGNYSFLFSGQDMSAKPAALGGVIHADGSSSLIPAAGGVSSDLNDNGTFSSQNLSGTFSVGANNRGSVSLLFEISGKSQTNLQFALYFVSTSDVFFVEMDSSTTTPQTPIFYRLSGEMIGQPSAVSFADSSLVGTSVATATAVNGSNASVLAGLLNSPSAGTATLAYDENNGGTVTSPSPSFSGTYVVATNGRVAFTNLGPRAAVGYLTGPGQGFLLGSDAGVTTGLLEQQTGITTFSLSSVEGDYTLGTSLPTETKVANLLGQVSSDGSGSILGTMDEIDPPSTSAPEGNPQLGTALNAHINFVGSTGRGTLITSPSPPSLGLPVTVVFYVLSPAHFRAISADSNPGNGHPEVFFFDH